MSLRNLFLLTGLLILARPTFADDPGITKVRLIQLSDSSYLLEADVPQQLIWAIKAPIFPDRFYVDDLTYEDQKGWVVVKADDSFCRSKFSDFRKKLIWCHPGGRA